MGGMPVSAVRQPPVARRPTRIRVPEFTSIAKKIPVHFLLQRRRPPNRTPPALGAFGARQRFAANACEAVPGTRKETGVAGTGDHTHAPDVDRGVETWAGVLLAATMTAAGTAASGETGETPLATAAQNGRQFERAVAASQRLLHAWLKAADPQDAAAARSSRRRRGARLQRRTTPAPISIPT